MYTAHTLLAWFSAALSWTALMLVLSLASDAHPVVPVVIGVLAGVASIDYLRLIYLSSHQRCKRATPVRRDA